MNKVYIIGIGPGTDDYLIPVARREIEMSDCLIGAERCLKLFHYLQKEKIPLKGNYEKILTFIKENREEKRIAVLVSGDPGMHSFLKRISKVLGKDEYVVIPGISTLQIAFAKIGEGWEDVHVMSLHGRDKRGLVKAVKKWSTVFLFTDSKFPPEKIASYLLEKGLENRRAIVMENLTYPDERILDTDLKHIAKMKGFGLCVMVIKKKVKGKAEKRGSSTALV